MIRFVTIGTSKITHGFIEAGRQCKDFSLYGVYSRRLETAREFADHYDVEKLFDSIEAIIEDDLVDAVYVASPNRFHYEQTMQLLKGKKHVICEKAFASNYAEAEDMIETARENGVVLLEAMRLCFDPGMIAIKEHLSKIGTPRKAFLEYCQYSSRYDAFKRGDIQNIFKPEMSAGALMDIGVYCVHAMLNIFDTPLSTYGESIILSNGIDGAGTILARYNELLVTLSYSKITEGTLPSQIQGEKGTLTFSELPSQRNVRIQYLDGTVENIEVEPCDNNKVYEIAYFLEAIQGKVDVEYYNKVTLEAMKILDLTRSQCKIDFPADHLID